MEAIRLVFTYLYLGATLKENMWQVHSADVGDYKLRN